MWEYLTLYSERDDAKEVFYVKNYPDPKSRVLEDRLLNDLGNDGWELVAAVPSYGGGGMKINHQLYLKRKKAGWGKKRAGSFLSVKDNSTLPEEIRAGYSFLWRDKQDSVAAQRRYVQYGLSDLASLF